MTTKKPQKIQSRSALKKTLTQLKKRRKKIVFTNGCFDILHVGHVCVFEKAKSLGDVLVVAVNADSSVRRLKGTKRPVVSEMDRMRVLASLESIDYVVKFTEDTPAEILEELRPDVLVKGGDYRISEIVGREYVKKVVRVKVVKGKSTTNIIKRIVVAYGS